MTETTYWVSYRSIVHRTDGKCSGQRHPWTPTSAMSWDRACLNCMPGELPRTPQNGPETAPGAPSSTSRDSQGGDDETRRA